MRSHQQHIRSPVQFKVTLRDETHDGTLSPIGFQEIQQSIRRKIYKIHNERYDQKNVAPLIAALFRQHHLVFSNNSIFQMSTGGIYTEQRVDPIRLEKLAQKHLIDENKKDYEKCFCEIEKVVHKKVPKTAKELLAFAHSLIEDLSIKVCILAHNHSFWDNFVRPALELVRNDRFSRDRDTAKGIFAVNEKVFQVVTPTTYKELCDTKEIASLKITMQLPPFDFLTASKSGTFDWIRHRGFLIACGTTD